MKMKIKIRKRIKSTMKSKSKIHCADGLARSWGLTLNLHRALNPLPILLFLLL